MNSALFVGDWLSLGMVHLELAPRELQPNIPFELDLFEGRAFVSLVFFTMRDMRLARGPRMIELLFHPFREQRFLNVRTYVRHAGQRGIHFIAEWISDPICVHLGPALYGLPYRRGKHGFQVNGKRFTAHVIDLASETSMACDIELKEPFHRCKPESLDDFLFERYVAFNAYQGRLKSFQVSHEPWDQCSADVTIRDDALLRTYFSWFANAHVVGGNYSPGAHDVLMGWPVDIVPTGRVPRLSNTTAQRALNEWAGLELVRQSVA